MQDPKDQDTAGEPVAPPGQPVIPDALWSTPDGHAAEDAGTPRPRPPRLTEILTALAEEPGRERVAIADMLETMRSRAFGALLLIFAFPNILPSPPGLAGVLGLPLIFLSTQMMLGKSPWLPDFIARRSMPRATFAGMVQRINPWLERAERLLKARLQPLAWPASQRLIGALCLVLSIALALPIPFANMAPSVAICLIGLGVLERDGLWIILGMLAAAGALIYVGGLGYALLKSAIFVITGAF
ncbi:exopolysaccharide biosynthesis protein [Rhodobacter sp. Har01]|uniref:exopolysaccharide biosynthesis protein n=1 Tax=Rhodobacter sp. Har01 TaxID=2883999 RepID=UPI001D08D08E|nr:exopolysaccharide biosynthesis protein [Rhodobacter sp. Har01]MCB6176887.1 exopolysaccharide biosynthesis protein [Rhodobacter sp. Har01]